MPTLDADLTKRADITAQIAQERFPYPSPAEPRWRTTVNVPEVQLGIQLAGGKGWMHPDIVVSDEPGHFIRMIGHVALRDEVTEQEARERWLPLAKAGPLFLFVPAGQAARAAELCRALRIRLGGLRTWRRSPGFGILVEDTYSGPDLLGAIALLLPSALKPRAYSGRRRRRSAAYGQPAPAQREWRPGAAVAALPSGQAAADADHDDDHAGPHLPPPSSAPVLLALGMILTGFGAIFPAELLGAGLAVLAVGVLRWTFEDTVQYPASPATDPLLLQPPAARSGFRLPRPRLGPALLALGIILTGVGIAFPAELLGAGLALLVLGGLGWAAADMQSFAARNAPHDSPGSNVSRGHAG